MAIRVTIDCAFGEYPTQLAFEREDHCRFQYPGLNLTTKELRELIFDVREFIHNWAARDKIKDINESKGNI